MIGSMATNMKRLAQRLKAARAKAGLTQTQLGERAGVGGSTITRLENCSTNPNLDNVNKVRRALREIELANPSSGALRLRNRRLKTFATEQLAKPDSPELVMKVLCGGRMGAVTIDELNFMATLAKGGDILDEFEMEMEVLLRRLRMMGRKARADVSCQPEFERKCNELRHAVYVLGGQEEPAD